MKKILKYINLNYTNSDLEYIDDLCNYFDKYSEEIVNFFNIDNFNDKIEVRFWDNLDEFRDYFSLLNNTKCVPLYLCGFAHIINGINYIEILSFGEYIKTKSHNNSTLKDLYLLLLHEFVHACHRKINNFSPCIWLREGLATTISCQYNNKKMIFDATLDEMIK